MSADNTSTVKKNDRTGLERVFSYGIPIAAFLASVVVGVSLALEKERSWWALAAAVVAAVATLYAAVAQHQREIKIDRLNENLKTLEEENTRLLEKVRRDITGGDSFAVAYFPFVDGAHWMTLRHFGTNTLREIRIDVSSFDGTRIEPPKHVLSLVYPSLLPNSVERVRPFQFKGDKFILQIDFRSSNGWWAETVKAVRVENELVFAFRAWNMRPGKPFAENVTLHQDVDSRFPRDGEDRVDWSVGPPISFDPSKVEVFTSEKSEELTRKSLDLK
jgi:hypothetical protein